MEYYKKRLKTEQILIMHMVDISIYKYGEGDVERRWLEIAWNAPTPSPAQYRYNTSRQLLIMHNIGIIPRVNY